ncbi:MAG: gliding motility lipoprotein GldH [Crocinitomicaceae bacterium]
MKRKIRLILLVIIFTGLLVACDDSVVYENNQSFTNNTWVYEDAKTFSFEISDSLIPVKLSVNLRTTTNYPYSNIYMFMHSDYPNGYKDIDTLEFFLADPEGNWLGDNSGTVVENRAMLSKGLFPSTGIYTFKLEQAMRNDSLPEVLDVGMRVERITTSKP